MLRHRQAGLLLNSGAFIATTVTKTLSAGTYTLTAKCQVIGSANTATVTLKAIKFRYGKSITRATVEQMSAAVLVYDVRI